MIHEAFPARRPFQKIIHAPLDVGSGEDWTNPGAVHRHPHRHPGMRKIRVEVNGRYIVGGTPVLWHFVPFTKRVVAHRCPCFGLTKSNFWQLQIRWSFSTCQTRTPPCVLLTRVGRIRHYSLPLVFCRWLNFFFHSYFFRSLTQTDKCSPMCAHLLLRARSHQGT